MQAASKPRATKAKPKNDAAVLQPINPQVQGGQAIEDIYQKKTQLEHILLRPDTYIGSTEKQQQKLWIHDGQTLRLTEVDYVPGLYKIFDEILVNAADNKVRDPSMDQLKVDIDKVLCYCLGHDNLGCVQIQQAISVILAKVPYHTQPCMQT